MWIERIKGFCLLWGLWCMVCNVVAYDFKSDGIYYRVASLPTRRYVWFVAAPSIPDASLCRRM